MAADRRTEIRAVSNPNFDSLLTFLLGFARKILPSQGGFSPFAAAVTNDGTIQPMAAYEGEHGSTQGHADLLIEAMRAAVDADKIVAGGLCTDIRVMPPDGAALVDAIQVHLEHKNGECVEIFLPYEKISTHELRYGDLFAAKTQQCVFWRR
jgi:hypothetical protein